MPEEELLALLAKLKDDVELREKLKDAANLDVAIAIAKEAGFDVSEVDWLGYQSKQTLELSDQELESVAGGKYDYKVGCEKCSIDPTNTSWILKDAA